MVLPAATKFYIPYFISLWNSHPVVSCSQPCVLHRDISFGSIKNDKEGLVFGNTKSELFPLWLHSSRCWRRELPQLIMMFALNLFFSGNYTTLWAINAQTTAQFTAIHIRHLANVILSEQDVVAEKWDIPVSTT